MSVKTDHASSGVQRPSKIDKTTNSPTERDTDQGWAWIVLTTSFLSMVIVGGQQFCFGNYIVPFLNHFGESRTTTSFAGGFQACVLLLTGPVTGNILHLLGSRMVSTIGGLLMATGFALLYFANSMLYITLVYGILVGIGACFTLVGTLASVTRYFKRHIFIASGITFGGMGVGVLTLGLVTEYLIEVYGWRGSMLIQSGISLQVCLFSACIFNQTKGNNEKISTVIELSTTDKTTNENRTISAISSKQLKRFKHIQDCRFWCLGLCATLFNFGTFPILLFLKDILLQKNLGIYFPIIIMTIGIGSTIGRISAGFISNHINPILFYFYVSLINTIGIFALSQAGTKISLAVVGFVFGSCHGYTAVLQSLKLVTVYGKDEAPKLWAYVMGYASVGVLIGPLLFGYIKDKTGVYTGSLAVCSIAICITGLFAIAVYVIEQRKKLNSSTS